MRPGQPGRLPVLRGMRRGARRPPIGQQRSARWSRCCSPTWSASPAAASGLDVEDVRGTLAPYHAAVREQIEHYGGTVEKFIGDAVMALFGAPVAHEDDPERAVRAALSIRARSPAERRGARARPARSRRREHRRGAGRARRRCRPRRGRWSPATWSTRPPACRPPRRSTASWSARPPTAPPTAPSPTSAEPVVAKGKSQPLPVWEAVEARARLGVDVVQRPTTPLVGRGRGGRPAARRASPLPLRARRAAGHACRAYPASARAGWCGS